MTDKSFNMLKMPDLFDFGDYRKYLKTWVSAAKSAHFSNLSTLSKAIGVHSTFLSHVLSGEKGLSLEQAAALAEEFKLTKLEQEYFFVLVQMDRAGTHKLKEYFLEKKRSIESERTKLSTRVGKHHELTDTERAIFYSSWIYVAIFVATAIEDSQSLEQIADRFELTRDKAQEIMAFLVQTGICEVNEQGRYKMGKKVVYVPNNSPFVVKHHTNWRMKAVQKMDERSANEMFFTSPVSMSQKDFQKVREILARTIEESLKIVNDSPAEEVYCLNIDFFKAA